ncbi:ABC transporter substrate-binding protein [Pigmentiphaga litoralis]|uniref:Thiamine pyrimidine synthase n=1 Tax=Pigmentiphaga litoralis TaxID=516702 RepID=A0A7Y9IU82_9BURK|nr:ABC transporter substrate-binding protein [Pigmentiphaga litoralis]NYE23199.1 NitT/TauT family transport system substrate-binding protein [Pigmentiphaga litoralis]NYE83187.1 NitT/TauT family transport system substrate-binding protein [Pigmentiphaga litoralis]
MPFSSFLHRAAVLTVSSVCTIAAVNGAYAAEPVKVRLDFLPYGLHAPFYLAKERGWFTEQGLDVTIEDGNGTGPALALVAGGNYDIAQISLGALPIARDKGMPVKAIAAVLGKGDFGAVVAESANIKSPKDLEGKTVYYSAGSVETPFIDTYLQRAGVDKSKVNLVNIDIGAKISGYMSGQGDAMFAPVSLYTIRGVTPRASRGMLFTEYGIEVPSFGLVANESTIAKRPKVLGSFVGVFQRAWVAIKEGGAIDEGVAALIKNRPQAKLDPAVMKAQIEAVYPFLKTAATADKPMLWMAPSDWAATVKVMESAKLIKAGTKPEAIYTNQFIAAK